MIHFSPSKKVRIGKCVRKEAHFMLKRFIQTLKIHTVVASGKNMLSRSVSANR
jgi:hypothetical protein